MTHPPQPTQWNHSTKNKKPRLEMWESEKVKTEEREQKKKEKKVDCVLFKCYKVYLKNFIKWERGDSETESLKHRVRDESRESERWELRDREWER